MSENFHIHLQDRPVAIIGMAATFAESDSLSSYWQNILEGKNCIKEVPDSRWIVEDYYDPDPKTPDKTYAKMGGFLPDLSFNPIEFGLPPNLLEVTDSSQLISLIIARNALEDAGYGWKSPKLTSAIRQKTAVILGVGGGQKLIKPLNCRLQEPVWRKVMEAQGLEESQIQKIVSNIKKAYVEWNENSFPGLLGNVIAGRIANRFDLGGINCVVDAACAAAMSALNMAATELTTGRADMVITGGVDTDNSPFMYMCFSKTPAFSPSGKSSPFDKASDGMLIGEGVGMMVLKRLEDAKRDGDRVYAIIKGIGTSSDGKFKSIYAPRSEGQQLAMKRAYIEAGITPNTVGLIEAHGTGTPAGDPTEFHSLTSLFAADRKGTEPHSIALGSVKSQIGHTKAAAGAAGMIKAALAIYHKVLPPTININDPLPAIVEKNSLFYLNTKTRPWLKNGHPRRAGVSAFGFGGVNVHAVLEEQQQELPGSDRIHDRWHQYIIQAADVNSLKEKLLTLRDKMSGQESDTTFQQLIHAENFPDIESSQLKIGLLFKEKAELLAQLHYLEKKNQFDHFWMDPLYGICVVPSGNVGGKVAILFSGQGSQYLNMGVELANGFQEMRQAIELADSCLQEFGLAPLSKVLYPVPALQSEEVARQGQILKQTVFAQPAIGTVSMGMYKLLKKAGLKADMFGGHSFGELSALWASGAFSDKEFIRLAVQRGKAMQAASENSGVASGMLAVKASEAHIASILKEFPHLRIANINSPEQLVLGGANTDLLAFQQRCKQAKIHTIQLAVSAAFHTHYVANAQETFANALRNIQISSLNQTVYANTTAKPYQGTPSFISEMLTRQLLESVHFHQMVEHMYQDGARIFLEVGPKGVLSKLISTILSDKFHISIPVNGNPKVSSSKQILLSGLSLQLLGRSMQMADFLHPPSKKVKNLTSTYEWKISGNNYVSPERVTSFKEAITSSDSQTNEEKVNKTITTRKDELNIVHQKNNEVEIASGANDENNYLTKSALKQLIKEVQESFQLQSHEQIQELKLEVNRQLKVLGDQLSLLQSNTSEKDQTPEHGNGMPASHQEEPLRKADLPSTNGNGHNIVKPVQVLSATETLTQEKPSDKVITQLLFVISEKTGYPSEMLELEMDLEADLGIDSIKRVEILGAMQEYYPSLKELDPQSLAELSTLQEIVECVPSSAQTNIQLPTPEITKDDIFQDLTTVISKVTGYPPEMLEPEMHMAIDLGIDTVKRKELFEEMERNYSAFVHIDDATKDELLSLEQLVEAIFQSNASASSSQPIDTISASQVKASNVTPAFVPNDLSTENPVAKETSTLPASSDGVHEIIQQLLEVISAKTGYPVEMLELNMDLASDLGIDSIKRVEILGAMQEQYPSLRQTDPQKLAEIRTLQGIVDQVAETHHPEVPPNITDNLSTGPNTLDEELRLTEPHLISEIVQQLFEVISIKTGYPVEMLELTMDLESDLGIDSIKRVEILGAMQEQYPSLRQTDPQMLAELRTLQEIVDQVAETLSVKTGTIKKKLDHQPKIIKLHRLAEGDIPIWYERQQWVGLADELVDHFPDNQCCLLIGKNDPLLSALQEALGQRGIRVVMVWMGEENKAEVKGSHHLKSFSLIQPTEKHIHQLIQEISGQGEKMGGIILVYPETELLSGDFSDQWGSSQASMMQVYWWAKHLSEKVSKNQPKGRGSFLMISQDGSTNDGSREEKAPLVELVPGMLSAFAKSLQREWPQPLIKHLHLPAHSSTKDKVHHILKEWKAPHHLHPSITIRDNLDRTVANLQAPKHRPKELSFNIDKKAVFLVSGGAKGVTYVCLKKWVQQFPCTVILVGSSDAEVNIPHWMGEDMSESSTKRNIMESLKAEGAPVSIPIVNQQYYAIKAAWEIRKHISALRTLGCQVEYVRGDISKAGKWQKDIQQLQDRYGPVTGLIHGAGRLSDKLIEKKTATDIDNVWGVKIGGLYHILDVLDIAKLTHLGLFSSVAAWFGNAGQTDYAGANGMLNSFAKAFKAAYPNCHVKAFNWGPWDSGMVTPALKQYFAQHHIRMINSEDGPNIFVNEFAKEHKDEVIVIIGDPLPKPSSDISSTLKTHKVKRFISLSDNPFLYDHVILGNPVLPMVHAVSWLGELAAHFYPSYRLVSIKHPKLFNGVVFEGKDQIECECEVKELLKNEQEIQMEIKVWSHQPSTLPRYHYQAEVHLSKEIPTIPYYDHQVDEEGSLEGEEIYRKRIMFHGPVFQGIDKVLSMTKEKIVMRCIGKMPGQEVMGSFPVHILNPILTDVQYQGMGVWVRAYYESSGLPVKGESVDMFRPIPFDTMFYATAEIKSHSPFKVVADVFVYDEKGKLYMRTLGAEVAISKQLDWTKA